MNSQYTILLFLVVSVFLTLSSIADTPPPIVKVGRRSLSRYYTEEGGRNSDPASLSSLGVTILGTATYTSKVFQGGVTKTLFQRARYYRSYKRASWEGAAQGCKALVQGTLLYFESDEEADAVARLLGLECCIARTYWVGGEYSEPKKRFIWTNGNVPFDTSLEWESDHRESNGKGNPNNLTRESKVVISTRQGRRRLQLQTRNNNETSKYICKLVIPYKLETSYLSAYPLSGTGTKWDATKVSL